MAELDIDLRDGIEHHRAAVAVSTPLVSGHLGAEDGQAVGVRRRLAGAGANGVGGGYGIRVLDAYATDPDVWRTRLLQVLTGAGVGTDQEILAASRAVLRAERRTPYLTADAR